VQTLKKKLPSVGRSTAGKYAKDDETFSYYKKV
jgi:hypothetical protein